MKQFLFASWRSACSFRRVPMAHPGHDHKLMGTISSIDKNKVVMKTTEGKDMTFEVTPTTTFKSGSKKGAQSELKAGMRVVVNVGDGVEPLKAKEVQYLGRRRPPRSSDPRASLPRRSERRRVALAIAVKDATETWRDGRFRWAAGLLFLLLIAAIAGGAHNQSQIARQHADAQQAERDVWLDKGDMNPHAAAHYGAFVFKPVQPLSAIDPGLDPFVGVFVFLEAHKQQLARHRPIEDATPTRRLGQLTPATAALVLLPLLVVSLTFSSFAGERDQGTLRPLLAMGISRWSLLAGKAMGAMLPLAAVIVPAAIIGAAFVFWNAPADPDAPIAARARPALPLVYLAHALIWIGLGLAVSARARSQGAALVVLLALWFAQRVRHAAAGDGGREVDRSVAVGDRIRGVDRGRKGFLADVGRARRPRDGALSRRRVRVDDGAGQRGSGGAARIRSGRDGALRSPLRRAVRALRAPGAQLTNGPA